MSKNTINFLQFKASDVKLAKHISGEYVKYDGEDFDPESPSFHAVPNTISFFFSANKMNMSSEKFAKKKFNYKDMEEETGDVFIDKPCFTVFMYPTLHRHSECDMSHLLDHFLPDFLDEITECTFALYLDEEEKISAYDTFKDLHSKGFVYNSEECDLADYFKTLKIVGKPKQ